jgi:hypothetical protein
MPFCSYMCEYADLCVFFGLCICVRVRVRVRGDQNFPDHFYKNALISQMYVYI